MRGAVRPRQETLARELLYRHGSFAGSAKTGLKGGFMKRAVLLGSFATFLGCSDPSANSGQVQSAAEPLSASEHCDSIAADDDIHDGIDRSINGGATTPGRRVSGNAVQRSSEATVEWAGGGVNGGRMCPFGDKLLRMA